VRDERPWFVVNSRLHPFDDEKCTVVAVTTTERERAVPIDGGDFAEGGVARESYVSAWFLKTREVTSLNEVQEPYTKERSSESTMRP